MRIQHNILAMNSNRWLGINQLKFGQNTERLSSGYRINRAADDAAGLSISEKMRAQIRGLSRASKNIQEGISLIQTAEGALQGDHSILQRMRELSVQAANDTNTQTDRQAIQDEIDELLKEVDRIAYHTEFNNGVKPLLGASDLKSLMYRYLTEKTCTFTASNTITIDDVTYQPGDSVTVTYVRVDYEMNGRKFDYGAAYGGSICGTGSGLIDWNDKKDYPNGPNDSDEMQSVSSCYDFPNSKSCSVTIDDFNVDENGDIYFLYRVWSPSLNNYSLSASYMIAYYDPPTMPGAVGAGSKGNPYNMKARPDGNQSSLWIQTGANMAQGINLSLVDATASGIGLHSINVMSYTEANKSLGKIDGAIQKISEYRSSFGAQQNRLEHAAAVDDNTAENLQASESLIRDANMSGEIMEYAKNHILTQIGQVMLAQANQTQQGILNLLI